MIIYLLIVTCIFLIFIAYIFSSEDIMSPSVLLGLGYLIATISCAMNIERWNVDLHENTYILIVTGIVSFLITEILFRYLKYKKGDNNYKKEKKYELR